MKAHLYLRASTKDQDENRARESLLAFAAEHGFSVADIYPENFSGTKLDRPELHRLLEAAKPGEILLVESVDRLSRLTQDGWQTLKDTIKGKGLRLVVSDLPTSWEELEKVTDGSTDIAGAVLNAINNMLIDLMATMSRLDQEKRVERIKQGLANKKAKGEKVGGRTRNHAKWQEIQKHLENPTLTMEQIAKLCDVGVATVYRVKAAI